MRNARNLLAAPLGIAFVLALSTVGPAEARRGGSFGSRGSRTYYAPPATSVSPGYVAPVQRSMTPNPGFSAAAPGQQFGQQRPRFGLGSGLVGGLLAGGLIGGLMGHGWGGGYGGGGGGGGLSMLFQLAILAAIVWAALRFFRRRSPAFGGQPQSAPSFLGAAPSFFAGSSAPTSPQSYGSQNTGSYAVSQSDQESFERLLVQLQDAFGKEDYSRLREITTPEVMSYLAEEMSQNAVQGRRNEVSAVKLVQADVSEAWTEGDVRYATVALRYESVDVMRDRTTGAVLSGDPLHPTQTTELWTYVQRAGGPWLVSAVQET